VTCAISWGRCSLVGFLVVMSAVVVLVRYISSVTGLEWPRGFQEVTVPKLHDNGTGWW